MAHSLLDHFARTGPAGQEVVVTLRSSRAVIGGLVAYDAHYNLILKPAQEMWKEGGKLVVREHHSLYVRGDTVVAVSRLPGSRGGSGGE